jgi:hypothetical protein
MAIDIQEVRLKVANRQPLSLLEIHGLFEAEGLLFGRQVIRTATGFIIILGPPVRQLQLTPMQPPGIEITEHAIRGIDLGGDRDAYAQMALMAKLRWGERAAMRIRGSRHLRAACRAEGLVVVNDNLSAKAWRALTMRPARRPRPPAPQPRPGPA